MKYIQAQVHGIYMSLVHAVHMYTNTYANILHEAGIKYYILEMNGNRSNNCTVMNTRQKSR